MFKNEVTNFAEYLINNENCKTEDKDLIVHGLCGGIELILNIVTTFILGIMFNMVLESFAFLIFYSLIRTYAGGYHCKKSINCYIVSSMTIVLVLLVVKFTNAEYFVPLSVGLLLLSIPVLLTLAPIGTETKMLDNEETEHFRKKTRLNLLIECIIIGTLFVIGLHNIALIVCLGIFVSAVLVLLEVVLQKIKNLYMKN